MLRLLARLRPEPDLVARLARETLRHRPASTALDVVRLFHIAQILHAGRHGAAIIEDVFEASAMGPMNDRFLAAAKAAVALARREGGIAAQDVPEAARLCIAEACGAYRGCTSAQIVATVHRDGGAWARRYRPDPADLLPMSDPSRHRRHRRDVHRGAAIRLEDLRSDYELLAA